MKKFCIFCVCILSIFNHSFLSKNMCKNDLCYAKDETTTYAKASALCSLYKTTNLTDEIDNIFFVIPETYFVTILEIISDNCMKVQYGNYVGFVDSSTIVIATFIPIVKILENITCDIKDTSGTQVWSKPSTSGTVLTTIPAGTKNIKYIAMSYGKIPSGGESNVWYYINYTPESNSTNVYEGYIYSENVTNLSEIVSNTETNPEIIKSEQETDDFAIYISSPVRALIIALIAVPVIILVLIVLYKISKQIKSKNHQKIQEPILNSKLNSSYNYENNVSDQNQLRNELYQMSERPFIKKVNPYHSIHDNYPVYPTYDSDDDML